MFLISAQALKKSGKIKKIKELYYTDTNWGLFNSIQCFYICSDHFFAAFFKIKDTTIAF